jgi:hypothetical protein
MGKGRMIAALLTTMAMIPWSPGGALGNHLLAPENVVCSQSEADLTVGWDLVDAAQKYSVDVIITYVGSTSLAESTQELSFPAPSSPLTIEEYATVFTADVDLDGTNDQIVRIDVKVKGLHPGRFQERQDNPFSSPLVECSLSA